MALRGRSAWLTGQLRTQSQTRARLAQSEFDEVFGLLKHNPLPEWPDEQVWSWIHALAIPYNPLHDQGSHYYGSEPCTRALHVGDDELAVRRWGECADESGVGKG